MSTMPEEKQEVETTGHSWDGIEEFNNPLPRWWLWTFYATLVWGLLYTIAYPAWPLINGATPGLLGFSTRAEVAKDIAEFQERNSGLDIQLASADLSTLADNEELYRYAVSGGAAVFRTWCTQCHGSGAAGGEGYPNLLDNDWLWGGTIEDIQLTIAHGIRNENDLDARYSEMPAFGEILSEDEISSVVNYVMSLSGEPEDATLVASGETVYLDNCAACHMDDGSGDIYQGAPNLANGIWLYGGDAATIRETVTYSRYGVMPNWTDRLSEAQIAAVATYVHQLGGGE
ncbi:MAG: cytochrome-c oxidase, cbb3-type subunit III [Pseudomonadota bacterium]